MKKPILSLIACASAFTSCALDTQEITFPEVTGKPKKDRQEAASAPASTPQPAAGDGSEFRLPDMLAMPDEQQLKSPATVTPSGDGGDGTVTAQPPVE